MSEDRRELILARLVGVGEDVFGVGFSFRNKTDVPENKRPCVVVLDADEERRGVNENAGSNRPVHAPLIMDLKPEIVIVDNAPTDKIGTSLNTQRAKFLKALLTDQTLVSLCVDIRYEGMTGSLGVGRVMEGQAQLHFTFAYHLRIDQL